MFKLFKRKSKLEVLGDKYDTLLEEAYELSKSNRAASDLKRAEAEKIMDQIKALESGLQMG